MPSITQANSGKFISLTRSGAFNRDALEKSKVNDQGMTLSDLKDNDKLQAVAGMEQVANHIYRLLNGEMVNSGIKIGSFVKNAINMNTFTSVFTPTVEIFIRDYIAPKLVVSNLLAQTIPVGPNLGQGMIALLRAFGLVKVKEVSKDGKLPTVSPNMGEFSEQMALSSRRFGVKVEIEQEFINSDQWGLLGFLFAQIGDGFRYRKELEVVKVINGAGEIMFDNTSPSSGVLGVHTAGRALDASFNGTLAMEDLRRVFAYAMARGIVPKFILVHPFMIWNMFGDSEMNAIFGAARTDLGNMPNTAAQPGWDHQFGPYGYLMRGTGGMPGDFSAGGDVQRHGPVGLGPLGVMGIDPFSDKQTALNQYWVGRATIPGMDITLVSSPQVPIKTVTVGSLTKFVTNMYVIGEQPPVAILQEQNPTTTEWDDKERDVHYVGFREKYNVIPLFQGRGIYTIKGVVIDRNYPIPTRVFQPDSSYMVEPSVTAKP